MTVYQGEVDEQTDKKLSFKNQPCWLYEGEIDQQRDRKLSFNAQSTTIVSRLYQGEIDQ